jgi:hypothetical protein
MRPASQLNLPLRPRRPQAPLTIPREPEGHGPHRVGARHGAERHDLCGARDGQAHGNGNRDTRRQDAVPGPPGRARISSPRLWQPALAKITSTGRGPVHGNLPTCTGSGGSQSARIGTPRARIKSFVTARMSRVPER